MHLSMIAVTLSNPFYSSINPAIILSSPDTGHLHARSIYYIAFCRGYWISQ
jgi:hypothetical protein